MTQTSPGRRSPCNCRTLQTIYGVSEVRSTFWIRLKNDEGWGEGTIPPYYGIDEQEMIAFWQVAANKMAAFPNQIEIDEWVRRRWSRTSKKRFGFSIA